MVEEIIYYLLFSWKNYNVHVICEKKFLKIKNAHSFFMKSTKYYVKICIMKLWYYTRHCTKQAR